MVRARHLQYKGPGVTTTYPQYWPPENLSDLARIRRDHEFLRVLATAVAKQGLSNPHHRRALVSGVAPQLEVDQQFSDLGHDQPGPRLPLGRTSTRRPSSPCRSRSTRSGSATSTRAAATGTSSSPPSPRTSQVIDQFLGVGRRHRHHDRPEAAEPRLGHRVGAQRHRRLQPGHRHLGRPRQALGFHMVGVGDTPSVGHRVRDGRLLRAEDPGRPRPRPRRWPHSLSGAVITALGPTTDGAQVTVVTGSQFAVNPPAATSTASTGASTTSAARPPRRRPPSATATSSTTTTESVDRRLPAADRGGHAAAAVGPAVVHGVGWRRVLTGRTTG